MSSAVLPRPSSAGVADRVLRGMLSLLSPAGPGARLTIAIFHRVLPLPDPLFPDEVDRARFDNLCAWLAAWYNVLPLDEAARRLEQGELPSRALVITFDDGYADNHDEALPVLLKHGLCATFFIATGFLDGGRMWNDTVVESVRRCMLPTLDLGGLGVAGLGNLPLDGIAARQSAIRSILGAIKYLPPQQRLALAEAVAGQAQVTLPKDLMMRSDQVRALAAAGMQIGAHTVSHPILARLDADEARREIATSKLALESLLGQPVTLFAYPNGKPGNDYLPRDVELVRELGFDAAVSTAHGAARAGDGVFQLPRFTPWDRQRWAFGARMLRNLGTVAATSA